MTMARATIIFAGGGTGGHLYPALAIADRIVELAANRLKVEIVFIGTKRGLEFRTRDSLGYPLRLINIRGLIRSMTFKNAMLPFVVVGALIKSWMLLSELAPDIVVGTGGYVSWPVLKVAAFRKIPTVLQEQNSFPGITTRMLAGKAKKIYLGFEKGSEYVMTSGEKIITGNPVRAEISSGNREEAIRHFNLDPKRKTILVLGGSQGARAINGNIRRNLDSSGIPDGFQILWQTGKRDYKEVADWSGSRVLGCSLFPFTDRMDLVYAAADFAVARAGALTLAELAACQVPALLVPYPQAAGDHQRKNAEFFVARGAAIMFDDASLDRINLIEEVVGIFQGEKLKSMQAAVAEMSTGRQPAVDFIAGDIIDMIIERKAG